MSARCGATAHLLEAASLELKVCSRRKKKWPFPHTAAHPVCFFLLPKMEAAPSVASSYFGDSQPASRDTENGERSKRDFKEKWKKGFIDTDERRKREKTRFTD